MVYVSGHPALTRSRRDKSAHNWAKGRSWLFANDRAASGRLGKA